MNNFEKKLKSEAQKIRLSEGEKGLMRARVFNTKVPSPYVAYSFQLTSVVRYALASLVLVALVGSGTASAAQGALPGDLLYPVKISVNERVELALAITPEKKVETEVRLAERRLFEAQALDEEERLDKETSEELEREFDRHVSNALAFADAASSREEDTVELEEEVTLAGAQEEQASEVTMLAVMKVELAPEATTTAEVVVGLTTMATDTASTTQKAWSRDDWFESLEAKRETWIELRQRVERRERGEVHGTFDEWNNDDKKDNDDDEDDDDNDEGKDEGDWKGKDKDNDD